ncbi:PAS domain-containing protein [Aureimonas fodinaquatilis]|uniref:Blue-light-activated histidine kinase n=1 Tax=Aureimonas fodinaquatilis TaxID=2565783 RepID=A0A5B0DR75_9HYPH|nr:PAS domain-containing protein [Aureimonas fodinaquatilis]KAA0968978.1 PAS domain-containing protein [Aureimonas fodinaquatilis]
MESSEFTMPHGQNPLASTGEFLTLCAMFDLLTDPVAVVSAENGRTFFNHAWLDCAHRNNAQLASVHWATQLRSFDREKLSNAPAQVRQLHGQSEREVRLKTDRGPDRWFTLSTRLQSVDGSYFWLHVLKDIHEQKFLQRELERKNRLQTGVMKASVDCIAVIRPNGALSHMNQAGCEALGLEHDSGFGMNWLELFPVDMQEEASKAFTIARRGESARFLSVSRLPGADPVYWDNILTPLKSPDDRVTTILCVSRNVTDQRKSELRIQLLMREMHHRSTNLLAIVQALVRKTVPDPSADYVRTLDARIAAIAKNQNILLQGQSSGASVLEIVMSQTVGAGSVEPERLLIRGDADVRLRGEAAEVISLAVHELTVNALKYGALFNECGTVAIGWSVSDQAGGRVFTMHWQERDGPVVAPPARRGFGSVVIERHPKSVLGAAVSFRQLPSGVLWELQVSADRVLAASAL